MCETIFNMLNNGQVSVSGMGTPESSGPMYSTPPGCNGPDYGGGNNSYLHGPSPSTTPNGPMGHHSGGGCSQMSHNPNNPKVRKEFYLLWFLSFFARIFGFIY